MVTLCEHCVSTVHQRCRQTDRQMEGRHARSISEHVAIKITACKQQINNNSSVKMHYTKLQIRRQCNYKCGS